MALERLKKLFSRLTETRARRPDDPRNPDVALVGMVAVTYRCQCKCKHCGSGFYTRNKSGELTTQEVKNLVKQFPALNVDSVSYFGGEPLLRDDICELVRYGRELGLGTVIDTNAVAFDEEAARRLAEAGLDMAFISIDSADAATHDKLRGTPGLFDRAVAAIGYCKKYGIIPRIATYVDREKLENGDFARLLELGEKLDVEIRILLAILAGRWNEETEMKLTPEEIRRFKSMLRPGRAYWEQDVCNSPDSNFVCAAVSKKMFYVIAYGEVTPCCYVPLSFGDARNEPLADILNRMHTHPMFENPDCTDCIMNDPVFRERYLGGFKRADSYPIAVDYKP